MKTTVKTIRVILTVIAISLSQNALADANKEITDYKCFVSSQEVEGILQGRESTHYTEMNFNICGQDSTQECSSDLQAIQNLNGDYALNLYFSNDENDEKRVTMGIYSMNGTASFIIASTNVTESNTLSVNLGETLVHASCLKLQ